MGKGKVPKCDGYKLDDFVVEPVNTSDEETELASDGSCDMDLEDSSSDEKLDSGYEDNANVNGDNKQTENSGMNDTIDLSSPNPRKAKSNANYSYKFYNNTIVGVNDKKMSGELSEGETESWGGDSDVSLYTFHGDSDWDFDHEDPEDPEDGHIGQSSDEMTATTPKKNDLMADGTKIEQASINNNIETYDETPTPLPTHFIMPTPSLSEGSDGPYYISSNKRDRDEFEMDEPRTPRQSCAPPSKIIRSSKREYKKIADSFGIGIGDRIPGSLSPIEYKKVGPKTERDNVEEHLHY